tara:strand:- start:8215 stop:10413 length:2199 start_codon:yes stop_codon:yes gene_type:complete
MNILQGVIEELGVVALAKQENGVFELLNSECAWFRNLVASLGNPLSTEISSIEYDALCSAFPFIENFLIDAEDAWKGCGKISTNNVSRSGIWTEQDHKGEEYQLEARACLINDQPVLLIENHTPRFSKYQGVYQKARDIALLNEKLVSELNQRQRQLQSEIERHIIQNNSIQQVADRIHGHTSAVMICQANGDVEVINKALVDIYQFENDVDLKRVSLLDQWIGEAEKIYPELKRVIESGSYWEGEFESQNASGINRWVRLTIGPIKEADGKVSHYVCVANDISELRGMDSDSASQSSYDFTTHLPNRRHFWRHINNLVESSRSDEYGIGLMYIDLDYFKRVNDDLGHQAGDFLLSTIAARISRCVKYHDFVAHLGGDEFVVVMQYVEGLEPLTIVADRILLAVKEPLFVNDQSIIMTASIGIAAHFESEFEPTILLRQADLAMYAAKELGKGQSRFYSPEMEQNIPHKLQRERELVDAIERQEFVLHLQPQISISGKEEIRVEALIRWQHPVHGLLPPADFIAIAENSGLIIPIGTWVLAQSCRIGAELLKCGQKMSVAINISAKQLKHPEFYNTLTHCLSESEFPASLVELEITESCFLEDMTMVISLLNRIRQLGVTIALDDFGTGFSSLNYLRKLPVDFLKIDRSFIQELQLDHESQAITASVIRLAQELNIRVVAEGVETVEQFNFLRKRKVNFVQGFLFYKPLSFEVLQKSYAQIKSLNDENKLAG